MKIVGVDPGSSHSGFALFEDDKMKLTGTIESGDNNAYLKSFLDMIDEFSPDVIVIEKFTLFPYKAKEQSWATFRVVELIGIIKFWAWEKDYKVVLQQPSQKAGFPDARLKRDGYYVHNIHARDSCRHALYFWHYGRHKEDNSEKTKN